MREQDQQHFEKMEKAIRQAIEGKLIKISDEFKDENEFFEWLRNQPIQGD